MDDPIPLRTLLSQIDPLDYKAHFALWNGDEHPLDTFARSRTEWAGWSSHRPQRDAFNRPFIFSMMQVYTEVNCWLYGGTFEVVGREPTHYELDLREDILPGCVGRLKLSAPPLGRNTRLNLETVLDDLTVAEILPLPYSGLPFPGHDRINLPLRQLGPIFAQQQPDWKNALQWVKGIYAIHDRTTGKAYVGSAYGETGIWSRWGQYNDTIHGGNVELRQIIDRDGDTARDNLIFSLLEYWPPRTSDDIVLEREGYWKTVLMSRAPFGYNGN